MMKRSDNLYARQGAKWIGLVSVCLAAGCATKPKVDSSSFAMFPPPPDEPRIQFLVGFAWESDLSEQSKFTQFVLGEDQFRKPILKPYGITSRPGMLYVCDTAAATVTMVDLAKKKIRYHKPDGLAAMELPINIAVDEDGTRYVTDTKRMQVLIYDDRGGFQGYLGQKGEMKPCGIALTADRLFVTDLSNHCVRVYSKNNRELLFHVPRTKDDADSKLRSPTNIALDREGRMYVSDTGGFVVKVFDAQGKYLFSTGSLGLGPGQFNLPKGVAVDREGRFYVVDGATGVVQLFNKEGKLLMFFGYPQVSGPGSTYLPAGVAVDYDNVEAFKEYVAPGLDIEYLIYLTNQAGKNRVSVYGFLRK